MTREEANDTLALWKHGLGHFPKKTINEALCVTGDLVPMGMRRATDSGVSLGKAPSRLRVWRSELAGGNTARAA